MTNNNVIDLFDRLDAEKQKIQNVCDGAAHALNSTGLMLIHFDDNDGYQVLLSSTGIVDRDLLIEALEVTLSHVRSRCE